MRRAMLFLFAIVVGAPPVLSSCDDSSLDHQSLDDGSISDEVAAYPSDWVDPPTHSILLESTDEIFLNPERGFYRSVELLQEENLSWVRDSGATLVHAYIRLDEYRDRHLDEDLLSAVARGMEMARLSGVSIVLRFAYNFGPYPDSEPDASLDWVLTHIEQLAPLLQDNADVIAVLQAGFIGAWGEWHSSTNGLLDEPETKFTILEALLAALPVSRSVQLRYPRYKEEGYGELTADEAYSGSSGARVGHHNDCFLASDTDWGTYPSDEVSEGLAFVAADTRFVPMGGETCHPNPPRSGCASALAEMELLHYSYINADYYPEVVESWTQGGCRDEMERRLGYRLWATEVITAPSVPPAGVLPLTVHLSNAGWAAPINRRPVFVVITGPRREEVEVELLDPRLWPGGEDVAISMRIQLPSDLPAGDYDLALWMPSSDARLKGDSRYALRLANKNCWEEETGLNHLVEIRIGPGAQGSVRSGVSSMEVLSVHVGRAE